MIAIQRRFASWKSPGRQNSKYPPFAEVGRPSVPVAGSKPNTPLRLSQAARFNAGSEPTRSRIISQAAMLSAPSGGGPIARETEHWGQKEMRCAVDFCLGLIPTVCANIYRATDLCPVSSARLQRKQYMFSKDPSRRRIKTKHKYCLYPVATRKYVEGFQQRVFRAGHEPWTSREPSCGLGTIRSHRALYCDGCEYKCGSRSTPEGYPFTFTERFFKPLRPTVTSQQTVRMRAGSGSLLPCAKRRHRISAGADA